MRNSSPRHWPTLLALVACALGSNAATLTVTNSADSGPGSLRATVAAAASGDMIVFDTATNGIPIVLTSGEIAITTSLTITGNDTTNTVVSGNNASRIFNITGAGSVAINSMKLTMGNSTTNGGAILLSGSMVSLLATAITNSSAGLRGGGIHCTGGTLMLSGSWVRANSATGPGAADGGGGIYGEGGCAISVSMASTISGNTATVSSGSGGGIFNNAGGTLTVSSSTLSGNSAARAGGGIEQNGAGSSMVLTNATLAMNNTGPSPGNGGGVHITGPGSAIITGGSVQGNTAATEGGGLWNGTGSMTVNGTVINGNIASGALADQGGGGLFNLKGTLTVQNGTTISNNMATGAAGSGGGIMNDSTATLVVLNSAITGNSAARAGGGIEMFAKAGQTATGTLTNVAISGNSTGASPGNGGGVHITGPGNMTVTSCTVTNNTAAAEGGGLWNGSGTMTIDDCDIMGNVAHGSVNPAMPNSALDLQGGGGIFNNLGTVNIVNSIGATVITGNTADGATFGSGGGILSVGGSFNITGATISMNETVRAGGGIENGASMMSITSSVVNSNDCSLAGALAAATPGNGGGIHVTGAGSMTVDMCTVDGNAAGNEGGGLWGSGTGTLTMTRSTASNNLAPDGGGLFLQAGPTGVLNMNYSTSSGNTATNGGGAQVEGGTFNITGSTIASNTATTGGGANIIATSVNANGALIGDNVATTGPDFNGAFATANYTLLENASGATGITNGANGNIVGSDAALQPLGNNGGMTMTHALSCGSQAINAGNPLDASTDQRGLAVIGPTRDIGAFEVQSTFNTVTLTITTDHLGSETTWEVRTYPGNVLVASGGPYADTPGGTLEVETICLPPGCFDLSVFDAGGDGISGGGYVLSDDQGHRIVDANGLFTGGASSINSPGEADFCLPLGPTFVKPNWCDRADLVRNDFVYAQGVAGATGYQFWFFDPHGSYSRRILKPTTACRLNFTTSPLPLDFDLNVRVRPLVGGNYQEFGKACRIRLDGGMMRSVEFATDAPHLSMYPNPNRDNALYIVIDKLSEEASLAWIDMFDALGKRVLAQQVATGGGTLNTALSLGGDFGTGMYLVQVRVDGKLFTERLIRE